MRWLWAWTLSIALLWAAEASAQQFGKSDDIRFAQGLWFGLKKMRLVGDNPVHVEFYEGVEPHGFVLEFLERQMSIGGKKMWVLVKRNYGPAGVTVQQVSDNPARYLKAITVMVQREKGYDEENRNWFWVKYAPDGTVMKNNRAIALAGRVAKGERTGCILCHAAAEGRDYVFNHDRFADPDDK